MLYFLLLGAALFVLFQMVSDDEFGDPDQLEEIIVSEGRIQSLVLDFEKTWQRPPSRQELDSIVESYVREEVFYREALALGLDRNDPIVRRRLRQKLEFLSEDLAALVEPEDSELQAFLDANPDTYRQSSQFSFLQVYLNSSQRGQNARADARDLLVKLQSDSIDMDSAGDSLMIEQRFVNQSERDIERTLGSQFLQGLREIPTGGWQGPIVSGFGLHLVYISERIDGEIPRLHEVRDQVFRDWASERRKQTNEAIYEELRKRYTVKVKSEK